MDFSLSDEQLAIQRGVRELCARFGPGYWLERDTTGSFPEEFHRAVAEGGWLGIAMPAEYGGAGLGITEAALMMQEISGSGAGFSGASAVHMNIFGLNPVVVFGSEEQKARWLPPLIRGEEKACFAVTEPDAGLDTSRIATSARLEGDHYRLSGQKVWISTGQVAEKMLVLARTRPPGNGGRPSDGLTLFYTDLDRRFVEAREIGKSGRAAVDSSALFIEDLPVPVEDRIGEDGRGFRMILHGFNPERILMAAEAVGLGRAALGRASAYARDRIVFDRPIGRNQGVQHPLARCWMELEAADLMVFKAATLYDRGEPCGAEANAAKYLAAEACYRACEQAVLTLGGMGYAKEYHVERYLREAMIPRLAPVSRELVLCFIAERVLGLPRSY